MNAENLQSSVEVSWKPQLLVKDRHHQVDRHRDPDLGFHRVGTVSIVVLDPEMAFDPAEEELDSPPGAIEISNDQRV